MPNRPVGSAVTCPSCAAVTYAVIPQGTAPVETGDTDSPDHDGKVWTSCASCEERFVVYYAIDD